MPICNLKHYFMLRTNFIFQSEQKYLKIGFSLEIYTYF